MVDRAELVRQEDEAWAEVRSLLGGLTPEQKQRPSLTPEGWSVKDLLWHVACWWAEAGIQLQRIRAGTYEDPGKDIDELNARFLEEGRREDLATVEAELAAARTRALQELELQSELRPVAVEWFVESGAHHYREHLPELRAWVDDLTRKDG